MKLSMLAIALATGVTTSVVPMAIAPVASADICAHESGRHFAVGGCTNQVGDLCVNARGGHMVPGNCPSEMADKALGTAIAAAHVPYFPGELPCYTVEGVPYFTPPGDPC